MEAESKFSPLPTRVNEELKKKVVATMAVACATVVEGLLLTHLLSQKLTGAEKKAKLEAQIARMKDHAEKYQVPVQVHVHPAILKEASQAVLR